MVAVRAHVAGDRGGQHPATEQYRWGQGAAVPWGVGQRLGEGPVADRGGGVEQGWSVSVQPGDSSSGVGAGGARAGSGSGAGDSAIVSWSTTTWMTTPVLGRQQGRGRAVGGAALTGQAVLAAAQRPERIGAQLLVGARIGGAHGGGRWR